jgi:hypothetical protein
MLVLATSLAPASQAAGVGLVGGGRPAAAAALAVAAAKAVARAFDAAVLNIQGG